MLTTTPMGYQSRPLTRKEHAAGVQATKRKQMKSRLQERRQKHERRRKQESFAFPDRRSRADRRRTSKVLTSRQNQSDKPLSLTTPKQERLGQHIDTRV